jgi:hypothetical protein
MKKTKSAKKVIKKTAKKSPAKWNNRARGVLALTRLSDQTEYRLNFEINVRADGREMTVSVTNAPEGMLEKAETAAHVLHDITMSLATSIKERQAEEEAITKAADELLAAAAAKGKKKSV